MSPTAFHLIIALVPLVIGFSSAKLSVVFGWVLFGFFAAVLGALALFSEIMRQASNTTSLAGYWGFLPIGGLIAGRVFGNLTN